MYEVLCILCVHSVNLWCSVCLLPLLDAHTACTCMNFCVCVVYFVNLECASITNTHAPVCVSVHGVYTVNLECSVYFFDHFIHIHPVFGSVYYVCMYSTSLLQCVSLQQNKQQTNVLVSRGTTCSQTYNL